MAIGTCKRCNRSFNEALCPNCNTILISDEDFSQLDPRKSKIKDTPKEIWQQKIQEAIKHLKS